MGYHRAGFDVVGVDLAPQPHFPFEFHQADAMTFPLDGFDAIHASPPCQFWTQMSERHRGMGGVADSHEDLLTPTLARLRPLSVPWVVENVQGAQRAMRTSLLLHGGMFGLRVHRPRLFESNALLVAPKAARRVDIIGVYGRAPDGRRLTGNHPKDGGLRCASSLEEAQEAMGMPWADWHGVKEAIPPAYTEFIGAQLLAFVERAA